MPSAVLREADRNHVGEECAKSTDRGLGVVLRGGGGGVLSTPRGTAASAPFSSHCPSHTTLQLAPRKDHDAPVSPLLTAEPMLDEVYV